MDTPEARAKVNIFQNCDITKKHGIDYLFFTLFGFYQTIFSDPIKECVENFLDYGAHNSGTFLFIINLFYLFLTFF